MRVTRSSLPAGARVRQNGSTIYTGCESSWSAGNKPVEGEVFDPTTGRNLPLPAPAVADTDEIVGSSCTVTADEKGVNRVVYLLTTKTPSHGLTPESEQTNLMAFDLGKSRPVVTKPFPLPLPPNPNFGYGLYPGTGAIVAAESGTDGLKTVAFIDPNTLEVESHVGERADAGVVAFNYDGYAISMCDRAQFGGCNAMDLHFFNGADGTEVGVFRNVGTHIPTDHGFLLAHSDKKVPAESADAAPGVFYFDTHTNRITGPIAPYIDLDDQNPEGPWWADQFVYGDTITFMGTDSSQGAFLRAFDMLEDRELFSLDGDQMKGLKIADAFSGDRFVYLRNESDNPVIDLRSQRSVSSGWTLRPIGRLAQGWVVILPGGPADSDSGLCIDSAFTATCPGGADEVSSSTTAYLARGETDDYSGPWY
jgi:hypothetical protein